jgi:hypothetical protein
MPISLSEHNLQALAKGGKPYVLEDQPRKLDNAQRIGVEQPQGKPVLRGLIGRLLHSAPPAVRQAPESRQLFEAMRHYAAVKNTDTSAPATTLRERLLTAESEKDLAGGAKAVISYLDTMRDQLSRASGAQAGKAQE